MPNMHGNYLDHVTDTQLKILYRRDSLDLVFRCCSRRDLRSRTSEPGLVDRSVDQFLELSLKKRRKFDL